MTLWTLLAHAAAFGFGYLLGSIPFGLILTRAAGLGDVRKIGSGNIGATNVLRTGSKKLAALTLFLDGFKGYAAVTVVGWVIASPMVADLSATVASNQAAGPASANGAESFLMTGAGLGAFLGHIWPIWLGFKGGKGVATYIGVLVGLVWQAGLFFCALWLVIALVFRYSSLSALVGAAATPIFLWWVATPQLAMIFAILTVLLYWKHRENIVRLMNGTESKIGAKSAQAGAR
jgi:glycerol-3-phosphate acyltransferase PlsY